MQFFLPITGRALYSQARHLGPAGWIPMALRWFHRAAPKLQIQPRGIFRIFSKVSNLCTAEEASSISECWPRYQHKSRDGGEPYQCSSSHQSCDWEVLTLQSVAEHPLKAPRQALLCMLLIWMDSYDSRALVDWSGSRAITFC